MEILLITLLFILIILAFPFLFEIRAYVDILDNFGMVAFKIFGIRVYFARLKVENKAIVIRRKNNKTIKEIKLSSDNIDFVKNFFKEMLEVVAVRKICVYSRVGTGNCFSGALLGGFVGALLSNVGVALKVYRRHADIVMVNSTDFYNPKACMAVRTRFFITPIDVVVGLIKAVKKTRKERLEWKKNSGTAK